MDIRAIQQALKEDHLDGWLLYDFHKMNPFALQILGFKEAPLTRRWFVFLPKEGTPVALVHTLDAPLFPWKEGLRVTYTSWRDLQEQVRKILQGSRCVAMEYSPRGALPTVSRVDAGTLEMVRACGVEVVSSANLLQRFAACWTEEQYHLHRQSAQQLMAIKDHLFEWLRQCLLEGTSLTEWDIQQEILRLYQEQELASDYPPIVAVGPNTADPHYFPSPETSRSLQPGEVLLIDLWAKKPLPQAVYADITWVAFCGDRVPVEVEEAFDLVRSARDAAVGLIQQAFEQGNTLRGYEVDDLARSVFQDAGMEACFVHRTGHNLGTEVHGPGVNLDNLETHDERYLLPGIAITVEPGLYLPGRFGVRSEINLYLHETGPEITTTPVQEEVVLLA